MSRANLVYVGIKSIAIALDHAAGNIVWETHLKGCGSVHLILDGDNLYATTQGEVFCLDPENGSGRWSNPLKGHGLGLASIAVRSANAETLAAIANLMAEEERRRAEQSSAAAAATTGPSA
jgi:outer membrane protein assembly factor BamB